MAIMEWVMIGAQHTKYCNGCGTRKHKTNFSKSIRMNDGLQAQCKNCKWNYAILKKFNMTGDDYNVLLIIQDGGCGICGATEQQIGKKLCIDHDHKTSEIRGLLCSPCNKALGGLGDTIDGVRRALSYLEWKPIDFS
ncbi:MAG: hypothetical protein GY714_01535 [Desulfobacterales bacterium]|nr:hypothetical protein [Desulfobacterales bacterium]